MSGIHWKYVSPEISQEEFMQCLTRQATLPSDLAVVGFDPTAAALTMKNIVVLNFSALQQMFPTQESTSPFEGVSPKKIVHLLFHLSATSLEDDTPNKEASEILLSNMQLSALKTLQTYFQICVENADEYFQLLKITNIFFCALTVAQKSSYPALREFTKEHIFTASVDGAPEAKGKYQPSSLKGWFSQMTAASLLKFCKATTNIRLAAARHWENQSDSPMFYSLEPFGDFALAVRSVALEHLAQHGKKIISDMSEVAPKAEELVSSMLDQSLETGFVPKKDTTQLDSYQQQLTRNHQKLVEFKRGLKELQWADSSLVNIQEAFGITLASSS